MDTFADVHLSGNVLVESVRDVIIPPATTVEMTSRNDHADVDWMTESISVFFLPQPVSPLDHGLFPQGTALCVLNINGNAFCPRTCLFVGHSCTNMYTSCQKVKRLSLLSTSGRLI